MKELRWGGRAASEKRESMQRWKRSNYRYSFQGEIQFDLTVVQSNLPTDIIINSNMVSDMRLTL